MPDGVELTIENTRPFAPGKVVTLRDSAAAFLG